MTQEAQRIAIAEACGWTDIDIQGEYCFGTQPARSELDARQFMMELPQYVYDLNAMHEAEKTLNDIQRIHFSTQIMHLHNAKGGRGCSAFDYGHATAAQRAEAFLRTLNLWRDDA